MRLIQNLETRIKLALILIVFNCVVEGSTDTRKNNHNYSPIYHGLLTIDQTSITTERKSTDLLKNFYLSLFLVY